MKKMLVADCCIRGEKSRTRALYREYLETMDESFEIEILDLNQEPIHPLTSKDVEHRDELLQSGGMQDEMFRYARQFQQADRILVAAPYWDLSFPSLLKVYLEQVSVCGVTFGYEGPKSVGYCRADKLLYFTTCGGFAGEYNLGAQYVKALGEMFGIAGFEAVMREGLDIIE